MLQRPSPEIGKIALEIWCYLAQVYTLGEKPENQEVINKTRANLEFFKRFLPKNLKSFLKTFKMILIFGPHAQGSAGRFPDFPCPMGVLLQILWIFHI